MVTRYADLIEAAHENLLTAQARTRHPAAWQSNQILTPYLADLAGALAHLGSTIGDTGAPARDLHTALRALARTDLAPTSPDAAIRGARPSTSPRPPSPYVSPSI